ncbi:Zn-ribbon domain-containing OB-fold protein [Ramlibacter sp. PS4R-6]|uniref:Zn-ribbon domain-containing OB-fold protein n=1 Tax=Ramlibacter sp. PS4R-6 TaxID=3133438 RepID=UPI00309A1C76
MTMTSYLPDLGPITAPQLPDHFAFWDYCAKRELRFQCCSACGQWRHPPAPVCPHCGSAAVEWKLAPSRAELFSYTVVHHASTPALRGHVPYNIAIVAFPDLVDIRIVSNVLDVPPQELRIGMPLQLVWQEQAPGRVLPLFVRAKATA